MYRKLHLIRVLEIVLDGLTSKPPLPKTVKELEAMVRTKNKTCTCETCTPRNCLVNCIRWPHFTIALHKHLTTNCYGNTVFAPPKLSSRAAWPPEGMHLARAIISYFDQPLHHLNNTQIAALDTFIAWRDCRWASIQTPFPKFDGSALLPASEMHDLWQCINTLFFGGAIPHSKFRWRRIKNHVLGRATCSVAGPIITMNPHSTSRDFGDYVILDFLSTLVHESIHAFLQHYPCWWCRSWDKDYSLGGHGRLFQLVAMRLEDVFPKLLGVPVNLGRFEAFLGDIGVRQGKEAGKLKALPSVHDLEEWRFEDVDKSVKNADVQRLIEQTYIERSI